jgi:hypothetical protein
MRRHECPNYSITITMEKVCVCTFQGRKRCQMVDERIKRAMKHCKEQMAHGLNDFDCTHLVESDFERTYSRIIQQLNDS